MISAKIFLLLAILIQQGYRLMVARAQDVQRQKPLPAEVADIYDADRYQKYLDYTAESKNLGNKFKLINIAITCAILFSPLFSYVEQVGGGDPYKTFFLTFALVWAVELVTDTWSSYEVTFGIREKYGLNKKDKKEFFKDEVLKQILLLFVLTLTMLLIIYVGENMARWTDNYTLGFVHSLMLCAAIFAAGYGVIAVCRVFGYLVLKKQYKFTPLEEGELKDKINRLQADAKKKVKHIYVYNESKKSTGKNAFLLKLFWRREFGIADNFMKENAEPELLAVLSHEIGHLKHRKDLRNFLQYGILAGIFFAVAYIISNPAACLWLNGWIRGSFGLTNNNYYLMMMVYGSILTPLSFLISVYSAYVSRCEEYEADREAVKNGYGEELIRTFKALSRDELVNVDPHPFVEFTEYDHPGMYRRIKAIREAVGRVTENELR